MELRARQHGKTTSIIRMIKSCLDEGKRVLYMSHTDNQCKSVEREIGKNKLLMCELYTGTNIRGHRFDNIFVDNFDLIRPEYLVNLCLHFQQSVIRFYGSYEIIIPTLANIDGLKEEIYDQRVTISKQVEQMEHYRKLNRDMSEYILHLEKVIMMRCKYNEEAGIIYRSSMVERTGKVYFDGEE